MTTSPPGNSPGSPVTAAEFGEWHRLHPLSPVVRAGRHVVTIVVLVLVLFFANQNGTGSDLVGNGVVVGIAVCAGVVSWLVTRWQVADGVLRIETGLIRRESRRFPLSRSRPSTSSRPGWPGCSAWPTSGCGWRARLIRGAAGQPATGRRRAAPAAAPVDGGAPGYPGGRPGGRRRGRDGIGRDGIGRDGIGREQGWAGRDRAGRDRQRRDRPGRRGRGGRGRNWTGRG